MKPKDETRMGGQRGAFLTTHWSLIGLLLERYWKPIYCYLRRKGYKNEEAKDLTQAFFHEIVLNRHLTERADPAKGRFRSFLLHALDQFLIDQKRKESVQSHIPKDRLVSLDIADLPELPEMIAERTPEECFTYTWKSELLDRTLRQVKAHFEQQGLQTHWYLFRDKVLQPTLGDEEPASVKDISIRYGIENESTAFNMLLTVKRCFKVTLRRNLRSTVLCNEDVDAEWRDLLALTGRHRPK